MDEKNQFDTSLVGFAQGVGAAWPDDISDGVTDMSEHEQSVGPGDSDGASERGADDVFEHAQSVRFGESDGLRTGGTDVKHPSQVPYRACF